MTTNEIFRCTVFSPDETTRHHVAELTGGLDSWRASGHCAAGYPDQAHLARLLRFSMPQLAIVDCRSLAEATDLIERLRTFPACPHILAMCNEDVPTLSQLMRLGVQDYITFPLSPMSFELAMERATRIVQAKPNLHKRGELISFLPAKPGSGTSTVAVNTAAALASYDGVRTLLIDSDFTGGTVGFQLKIDAEHSLKSVLANIAEMDDQMWSRMKVERGPLDVLCAPLIWQEPLDLERLLESLNFFQDTYQNVCVDLGPSLDAATLQILRESQRIYIVTTPELASQHMLRRKAEFLRTAGLSGHARVILNRTRPGDVMDEARVEEICGLKVEATVPNHYLQVKEREEKGQALDPKSPLGSHFDSLASIILKRQRPPQKKRGFFEMVLNAAQSNMPAVTRG